MFRYRLADFISFRDFDECRRVAAIPKSEICNHPNPDFRIRIVEEPAHFYTEFALDLVGRIAEARDAGRRFVAILPVGPVPQYKIVARIINTLRIPLDPCPHLCHG
jgi:glucosamine-6-phosphate deaminase